MLYLEKSEATFLLSDFKVQLEKLHLVFMKLTQLDRSMWQMCGAQNNIEGTLFTTFFLKIISAHLLLGPS